jgi:hypothetical protein
MKNTRGYEIKYEAYTLSGHERRPDEDYVLIVPEGQEIHKNTAVMLENPQNYNWDRISNGFKFYGTFSWLD